MVQQLLEKEAPMKEIKINPEKLQTSRKKKKTGVIFSPRSTNMRKSSKVFCLPHMLVYMMKDEEVFHLNNLLFPEYALSVGLVMTSWIRFLQKM